MDEEYDVIILGTGLKECILGGVMSKSGKKVLTMDRNNYYGAESASMTPLADLFKLFGQTLHPEDKYGRGRDWNIDLVSKFIMAHGSLTKLLIHTDVTRYLEFQQIEGSYIYKRGGNIHKIPASDKEALATSLMGIFEKRRFKNFLVYAIKTEDNVPSEGIDPNNTTMTEVYKKFGLDDNTGDFVGHGIALYDNDDYKDEPCGETLRRIRLYYESLSSYGKSPYLYPLYGLGELPQGFARLSAVYGGTFMLDKPCEEIVMEDGKFVGVCSQGETARGKLLICDPSYVPDRVTKTSQVVRALCLLKHTIAKANNSPSAQIIIPANQADRKHDIYVSLLSNQNQVAAKGYYLASVCTTVETSNPEAELSIGLDLLQPIEHKFVTVKDIYEPIDDGKDSQIFITKSYGPCTHFDQDTHDIKDIYERIFGEPFDEEKIKGRLGNE